MSENSKCRHSGSTWILAGGAIEWCYACGALRKLEPQTYGGMPISVSRPSTTWVRPTGDKARNPYNKMRGL